MTTPIQISDAAKEALEHENRLRLNPYYGSEAHGEYVKPDGYYIQLAINAAWRQGMTDAAEKDKEIERLKHEWSIMARACGNWREWPNEKTNDCPEWTNPNWLVAAKAIQERDQLSAELAEANTEIERLKAEVKEWRDDRQNCNAQLRAELATKIFLDKVKAGSMTERDEACLQLAEAKQRVSKSEEAMLRTENERLVNKKQLPADRAS